eukprot:1052908-Alexandrium_andersonii.AAC.1
MQGRPASLRSQGSGGGEEVDDPAAHQGAQVAPVQGDLAQQSLALGSPKLVGNQGDGDGADVHLQALSSEQASRGAPKPPEFAQML